MLNTLSSREQFTQALKSPVVARTAHFVLHLDNRASAQTSADAQASLGCVLPKRWARRAVTRNLLRRLVVAQATLALDAVLGATFVVRLRAAVDPKEFPSAKSQALRVQIRQEIQTLFEQALKRLPGSSQS